MMLLAAAEGLIPDRVEPVILFLAGFTALGTAMMLCFNLFDRFLGKSQERKVQDPLNVRMTDTFVTRSAHQETCSHMERRVSALELRASSIERKMEADKTEIIEAGAQRLAELRAEIRDVRKDLAATPAQIVALLKNTKGLIE